MTELSDALFMTSMIEIKEGIPPSELYNTETINDKLLYKIKNKIGDKCSNYGYIKKESIKIVDRSLGEIISSHFSGNIVYNIKLEVSICSPSKNDIISCKVVAKNKIGILCENLPFIIILSKDYHKQNSKFDLIQEQDIIDIKILDYKYKYTDSQIQIVGELVK
jgi:DNA-directed RNA polymerase subunit E'/Rpb7|tara:strand:- start:310 stop:801 length:492 start_codon:yes stop_codon:yes gene_type:complete